MAFVSGPKAHGQKLMFFMHLQCVRVYLRCLVQYGKGDPRVRPPIRLETSNTAKQPLQQVLLLKVNCFGCDAIKGRSIGPFLATTVHRNLNLTLLKKKLKLTMAQKPNFDSIPKCFVPQSERGKLSWEFRGAKK